MLRMIRTIQLALKSLLLDHMALWLVSRNQQRVEAEEAPDGWVSPVDETP